MKTRNLNSNNNLNAKLKIVVGGIIYTTGIVLLAVCGDVESSMGIAMCSALGILFMALVLTIMGVAGGWSKAEVSPASWAWAGTILAMLVWALALTVVGREAGVLADAGASLAVWSRAMVSWAWLVALVLFVCGLELVEDGFEAS